MAPCQVRLTSSSVILCSLSSTGASQMSSLPGTPRSRPSAVSTLQFVSYRPQQYRNLADYRYSHSREPPRHTHQTRDAVREVNKDAVYAVRVASEWQFPANLAEAEVEPCGAVYRSLSLYVVSECLNICRSTDSIGCSLIHSSGFFFSYPVLCRTLNVALFASENISLPLALWLCAFRQLSCKMVLLI